MVRAISCAVLAAVLAAAPAAGQTPGAAADSFEGRTVTVIVGSSPGGGYDTYGRLIARHIGKHLPGKPTVVVKNMPGAGGVVAATYLYKIAPKGGTEIAILADGTMFQSLLIGAKLEFDPRRFAWLGAVEKFVPIVVAWHTTPIKTYDDLLKHPMRVGSDGVANSTSTYPLALNGTFGTKFQVISGYPGSAQITLAVEKGEIDGIASWCWDCMKTQKPHWVEKKLARVVLQLALEGSPELTAQGIPTLLDIAKTPEQRAIVELVFSGLSMSRPFAAPPDTAPGRLQAMRQAFAAVVKDPELLAEAARARNAIIYTAPLRIDEILAKAFATDPAVVKKVQAITKQ